MSAFRVRPFRAAAITPLALGALGAVLLVGMPSAGAAQPPVGLGTADSFAVLAYSGITNTGATTITGDVGTFPTASETGFNSLTNFVTLTGTNHAGDAVTQGAKNDLVTAYNDAAGRTPVTNLPVELGGSTLVAGVYVSGTFGLTGTLTLDAKGNPGAEFIFKTQSTLITASNSRVLLINGADPCHVVWKVGSSATFSTGTQFVGDVLAHDSIAAQTSATFQGRLLASNGAVTLDTNTITRANCVTSGGSGTTSTTTGPTSTTVNVTATPVGPTAATPNGTPAGTPAGTPGGTPAGTPGGTPAGTPSGTPGGTPGTPGGTPGGTTPGTPGTGSTPPKLPFTGADTTGPIGVGLALLALGAVVLAAERRVRRTRPTSR